MNCLGLLFTIGNLLGDNTAGGDPPEEQNKKINSLINNINNFPSKKSWNLKKRTSGEIKMQNEKFILMKNRWQLVLEKSRDVL